MDTKTPPKFTSSQPLSPQNSKPISTACISPCNEGVHQQNIIKNSEPEAFQHIISSSDILSAVKQLSEQLFLFRSHMRSMAESMQLIQQKVDMISKDYDSFISHRDFVYSELQTIKDIASDIFAHQEDLPQNLTEQICKYQTELALSTPISAVRSPPSPKLQHCSLEISKQLTEVALSAPPPALHSGPSFTQTQSPSATNSNFPQTLKNLPQLRTGLATDNQLAIPCITHVDAESESDAEIDENDAELNSDAATNEIDNLSGNELPTQIPSWSSSVRHLHTDIPASCLVSSTPSNLWANVSAELPVTSKNQTFRPISLSTTTLAFSGSLPTLSQPLNNIKLNFIDSINKQTGMSLQANNIKSVQVFSQSLRPKLIVEFANSETTNKVWNNKRILHSSNIYPEQWLPPKERQEQHQVLKFFRSQRQILSNQQHQYSFNAFSQGNSIKIVDCNSNKYFFNPCSKIQPLDFLKSVGLA